MSLSVPALVAALADGHFHTGEALGAQFGVSKAAIWKAVHKLADLNLDVHSVRGKGYRLAEPLCLLSAPHILAQLSSSRREQVGAIEILHSIDSTNTHALRQVQSGTLDLAAGRCWLCLAETQSAGKGRRGRDWVSPFGHNLYLSLVREFSNGAAALDGLSLVVGLAVATALADCGYRGLQLKWPNDVLLDGRKLAGILLEVSGDVSGLCHVVIGIGLNLRSDKAAMAAVEQPWIALDQAGFQWQKRNQLAGSLLNKLLTALQMFEHSGFAPFMPKWQEYDCTFGRDIALLTASGAVPGKGRGVNQNGALLLETVDGSVQRFHGGEVSLRFQPDAAAADPEHGPMAGINTNTDAGAHNDAAGN
jgi:BirA family transcriptional regulator, biotin operon repressor / biotin---[acetyl-CoA-carboxylase] ligase